jgi:hypothetical protein
MTTKHLFELGDIVATPGALAAIPDSDAQVMLLVRHLSGDWGCVGAEDAAANNAALTNGTRLLSVYPIDSSKPCQGDNRVWIITEADRSVTTLLLPDEY